MSPQDLAAFNYATTLASTQPLEAYNQLTALVGRNSSDGNLLAWLIFTAPDYAAKERWANQAKQLAPSDYTVQRALSWFASQPKPASVGVMTAPPSPTFQNNYGSQPSQANQSQYQQQPVAPASATAAAPTKAKGGALRLVLIGLAVLVIIPVAYLVFLFAQGFADPYLLVGSPQEISQKAEIGKQFRYRITSTFKLPPEPGAKPGTPDKGFAISGRDANINILFPAGGIYKIEDIIEGKMVYITITKDLTFGNWEAKLDKVANS
jgi:hypothetical protein